MITFTVRVSDPDIIHGEVLTVTWTSNVSGVIGSDGTIDTATTTTSTLPPGEHRVYVKVSDGTFESIGFVDITVVDTEDPLPPPEPSDLWLYAQFILVFALMIAIGYYAGSRGAANETD